MTNLVEQLKHSADQAWESLSDGWRELGARASGALTRFWPTPGAGSAANGANGDSDGGRAQASANAAATATGTGSTPPRAAWLPRPAAWAFLAADVYDDADQVIVRVEAPGMQRADFHVQINGDVLTVCGEKRVDSQATQGRWHVVQCAYGSFRRDVALPVPVKADHSKASYRDGVLRIELPKADAARTRRIAVQAA